MKLRFYILIVFGIVAAWTLGPMFVALTTVSAQETQSVWDGVFTEEQAKRGEPVYQEACARCHAYDLTGGEMAPGLVGGEFVWNWHGLSVGDLFERLRVTMPEGNPGEVSRQEKADILAFILLSNDFPVGDAELQNRTQWLNPIAFEAIRP